MNLLKRTLSLVMATALAASTMAMPAAAAVNYKVGKISTKYYVVNDDGYVDMSKGGASSVPYGQTAYFPLLNERWTTGSGSSALQTLANDAKAKGTALTALSRDVKAKADLWVAADTALTDAQAKQTELQRLKALMSGDAAALAAAALAAQTNDDKAVGDLALANVAKTNADSALKTAQDAVTTAKGGLSDTQIANLAKGYNATTGFASKQLEVNNFFTAIAALDALDARFDAPKATAVTLKTKIDSITGTTDIAALQGEITALVLAINTVAVNTIVAPTVTMTVYKEYKEYTEIKTKAEYDVIVAAITNAESDVTAKQTLATTAASDVTSAENAKASTGVILTAAKKNQADFATAAKNFNDAGGQAALDNAPTNVVAKTALVATAKDNYTTSIGTYQIGAVAYTNAVNAYVSGGGTFGTFPTAPIATLKNTSADAQIAAAKLVTDVAGLGSFATTFALPTPSGTYGMVNEPAAVSSARIKSTWDAGNTLVGGTEIVKKRIVVPTSAAGKAAFEVEYGSLSNYTGANQYAYFLSVKIKPSSSVKSVDVYGTTKVTKSGTTDGFEVTFDPFINATFSSASAQGNDNMISTKPTVFKSGDGFWESTEEEFRFECDPDHFFTVNTMGQGSILLAADAKYDGDIANKYSNANLDFFSGNGASFNRTGILSISAPENSYLYKVNSDGSVSEAKASYDKYEEAFKVNTRTLGKYVISDIKLKIDPIVVPIVPETPVNPNPPTGVAA